MGTDKRDYGIDLLKIISMIMICGLHILGSGGVLKNCLKDSANWYIAWLLEIICFVAVNCYAMVTGYLNLGKKTNFNNIVVLWLQTIFYSVIITGLFFMFTDKVGITRIIKAFLPITSNTWWYFTSYIFLFLFIPVLNLGLEKLDKLQLKLIIFFSILMPFIASVLRNDGFGFIKGYSPIWLMIMYIIGGYIKKYKIDIQKIKYPVLWFFAVSVSTLISKVAITYLTQRMLGYVTYADVFIEYTSPTVVAASILFFVSFLKLKKTRFLKSLHIEKISILTFGVYLIHVHPLVFDNIIFERFAYLAQVGNPIIFICGIIFCTLAIFVICLTIEYLRSLLFKLLKIKDGINKLSESIVKKYKKYKEIIK